MLTRRHLLAGVPPALALLPAAYAQPVASVMEDGFVPIGGIEQWISIRGRDRARPALLFLHGGPGEAQSPFLPLFAPWEERYVVVQWDQRGSGKTFEKNGPSTPDMTLEQMVRDAADVARYALGRLGSRKLILVGHSWGSILGLSTARAQPDLFHAFVGTGEVVSGKQVAENWRSAALLRARAPNDAQAVAALNGLSDSDILDFTKLGILFKWMPPFIASDWNYLTTRLSKTPAAEAANWNAGSQFSLSKLWRFAMEYDARAAGYDLPLPFFVIQGRDDNRVSPVDAREFVTAVQAPAKGYTAIDGGHFACFTNPAQFLAALNRDAGTLAP